MTPHARAPTAPRPLGPSQDLLELVRRRWPSGAPLTSTGLLPADRRAVADLGEAIARVHLERAGHVVVASNWRSGGDGPRGELDLVTVAPGGCLVVVEVKARRSGRQGSPAEAVTHTKRAQLRALAMAWVREHPDRRAPVRRTGALRFDVVAIRFRHDAQILLEHLEAAF